MLLSMYQLLFDRPRNTFLVLAFLQRYMEYQYRPACFINVKKQWQAFSSYLKISANYF